MKKIATVIVVVIIALFIIGLVKDQIIKSIVTAAIEKNTGTKAAIGGFSLGLLTHSVEIKNFKMYNPSGFPQGLLIDLPYAKVDLDVPAFFKKELHLRELTVELRELDLVKNKQGEMNVDALKVSKERETRKPVSSAKKEEMPMRIDTLNLKIGKIVSKDYTASGEPLISVNDVNIQKTYKNITSISQLILLILTEPMKSAGIKGAKIYGLAALTGVGFVPIAIGSTIFGKSSNEEILNFNYNKVYDAALKVITKSGAIKNASKETGVINANVDNATVMVDITQVNGGSKIKVSARKYFLPKPEIASGIIYKIKEELK